MVFPLENINIDLIQIREPKKYDAYYLYKINYDAQKLVVLFEGVVLCKVQSLDKKAFNLYLKLPSLKLKKFLEFEHGLVDVMKQNYNKLFSKRLRGDVIEEYYNKSVIVHKDFGKILKVKVEDHELPQDLLLNNYYTFHLRAHSLKLSKQSLILLWDIEYWTQIKKELCFIRNESDDDDEFNYDESIGPTEDDLNDIKSFWHAKLCVLKSDIESKLEKTVREVEEHRDKLEQINELMMKTTNISLNNMDVVMDELASLVIPHE